MITERQMLESEISTLERMIQDTPTEDVIDRHSLEDRKEKLEDELAKLDGDGKPCGLLVEYRPGDRDSLLHLRNILKTGRTDGLMYLDEDIGEVLERLAEQMED